MLNHRVLIIAFILLLGDVLSGFGQEATEMFIPIGQSPGISDSISHIGTIDSTDQKKSVIVVACHDTHHSFVIDNDTPIWIDRSQEKLSNLYGTLEDLISGRKVEVYLTTEDTKTYVKWIKVQL